VEPLIFYFDRNAGKRLPQALNLLKLPGVKKVIHHHSEKRELGLSTTERRAQLFHPETRDDEWLEFAGKEGWIVFSQDSKFHRPGYEHECLAIKQFKVGCFYLWGGQATTAEKALVFLKAHQKIIAAARTTPKPFLYKITKSGSLKRIPI
jgi:hypothetical protein